jgi:hypothetical protein
MNMPDNAATETNANNTSGDDTKAALQSIIDTAQKALDGLGGGEAANGNPGAMATPESPAPAESALSQFFGRNK